jgi:hypothetical protein
MSRQFSDEKGMFSGYEAFSEVGFGFFVDSASFRENSQILTTEAFSPPR